MEGPVQHSVFVAGHGARANCARSLIGARDVLSESLPHHLHDLGRQRSIDQRGCKEVGYQQKHRVGTDAGGAP